MPVVPEKIRSVSVAHATKRSGMALLPIYHKPLTGDSVYPCPNCQIIHTDSYGNPVKTVHLWLDDTGKALVSEGVLKDLQKAGHFLPLGVLPPILSVSHGVANPPGITLGRNRFEVDQENAKIQVWKKETVIV